MNDPNTYRLAIWDDEAFAGLATRIADSGRRFGIAVDILPRTQCELRLRTGTVEAALVPAVHVLSDTDVFDVYPAVAISAWRSPHASIRLRQGLGSAPRSVSSRPDLEQERLMTRIVLREHYGMEPEMVVGESDADGVLKVGEFRTVDRVESDPANVPPSVTLDLGQEWFELTNYPMVWGLFVSRRGEAEERMLTTLVEAATVENPVDDPAMEPTELLADARVRFRLDDIATASLTELADLLFYYRVTEDVPELHFAGAAGPVDDEGEDGAESGEEPS